MLNYGDKGVAKVGDAATEIKRGWREIFFERKRI
jgi:hypothetical protein